MKKIGFQIIGMNGLQKSLSRLGKVPQKHVTTSAKKGMNIVLKGARANAPYDTGELKKGMVMVGEKSKYKGKKIYKAVFDDKKNDIFQKKNKDGEVTGYYPFSQEYGYFARNGRYIPGFRFLHGSLENNSKTMRKTIITTMKQKIDQEIRKAGLR